MSSAPSSRRLPAKHDAILQAATKLFLAEGFTRVSVDAIAEAAGVGKQTVYGHFGDKNQLFLAVMKHVSANSGMDLVHLITDTDDPRADLAASGRRLVQAVTAPEAAALHRLTIAELPHQPELQRSWRDKGASDDLIAIIADYLAAVDRRGGLDVPRPAIAARQFVMLLSAEAQVRSLRGVETLSDDQIADIVDGTVDLLVRAHRPLR